MCGIFGAVFLGAGDETRVNAEAALASIAHRGPDDRGIHRDAGVVLGHVRLSILDLTSAGHQPMVSPDGAIAVVFNGELYNHHELRHELETMGYAFASRTDTEVIVHGYRAWGERVVERIDGMFAIGVWDRNERKLLLARDRAGKKPLFYAEHHGALWFASEAKALFAAGLPAEVDVESLPLVLALGYTPAPHTMYRGVRQLAPATLLVRGATSPEAIREYWRIPVASAAVARSTAESIADVRRLVEDAVRKRLEADVPLGAFLSGGVDSTIVVGVMARLMGERRVKTFSIGFSGDPRYDETRYARIAAKAFSTEHTEFVVDPSSFELVERLVELHDGPFGDSSAVPTSIVSMLTRKHVTVALSGDGGDELFCGYPRFLAAEASERIPRPVRVGAGFLGRALPRGASDRAFGARVHRFLKRSASPLAERVYGWTTYFNEDMTSLLRPELRRSLDLDAARRWNHAMMWRHGKTSALSQILTHNYETYLPYDLLVKADRSSMLHSLEVRSPFLDTALVEYAARLPDSAKRRGTTTKWILRKAFEDLIPLEIQTRSKMGFGIPLATWFRGDLRSYLDDRFAHGSALYDYVDEAHVRRMLAEHAQGAVDHSTRLWILLTLQIWLQSLRGRRAASTRAA